MSWLFAIILAMIPVAILGAGYDKSGQTASDLLMIDDSSSYANTWVHLPPVCVQAASASTEIEADEGKVLKVDQGIAALRVGSGEGRIYYLVTKGSTVDSPQKYALVSAPATGVVERQISTGGVCS